MPYSTVSSFLDDYRKQNPQFQEWGDDALYSVISKAHPETSSLINEAPAPKYTDWSSFVSGYKELVPETRDIPDIDLASQLRTQFPVLKVFDAPPETREQAFARMNPNWVGRPVVNADTNPLYQQYRKLEEKNRQSKQGFLEGISSFDAADAPLFIGDAITAKQTLAIKKTAEKLNKGEELSDDELLSLNLFLAEGEREANQTFGGQVGSIVRQAIPFAIDIAAMTLLTSPAGGGGTIAQKLAAKGASRGLYGTTKKAIEESLEKWVANAAGSAARHAVQKTAAMTGGALAMGGALTGATTLAEAVGAGELTKTGANTRQVYDLLQGTEKDYWKYYMADLGSNMAQYASEFSGEWLGGIGKAVAGTGFMKQIGEELGKKISDITNARAAALASRQAGKTTAQVAQEQSKLARELVDEKKYLSAAAVWTNALMTRKGIDFDTAYGLVKLGGYNGILEEFGEERVSGFFEGLMGNDGGPGGFKGAFEGALPDSTQDAMAEIVAFSLPMAWVHGVQTLKLSKVTGGPGVSEYLRVVEGLKDLVKERGIVDKAEFEARAGASYEDFLKGHLDAPADSGRVSGTLLNLLAFPFTLDPFAVQYRGWDDALIQNGLSPMVQHARKMRDYNAEAEDLKGLPPEQREAEIDKRTKAFFTEYVASLYNSTIGLSEGTRKWLEEVHKTNGVSQEQADDKNRPLQYDTKKRVWTLNYAAAEREMYPDGLGTDPAVTEKWLAAHKELDRAGVMRPRTINKFNSDLNKSLFLESNSRGLGEVLDTFDPARDARGYASRALRLGLLNTGAKPRKAIDEALRSQRTLLEQYREGRFGPGSFMSRNGELFMIKEVNGETVYLKDRKGTQVEEKLSELTNPNSGWAKPTTLFKANYGGSLIHDTRANIEKEFEYIPKDARIVKKGETKADDIVEVSVAGLTSWNKKDNIRTVIMPAFDSFGYHLLEETLHQRVSWVAGTEEMQDIAGYDAAKALKQYIEDNKLDLPEVSKGLRNPGSKGAAEVMQKLWLAKRLKYQTYRTGALSDLRYLPMADEFAQLPDDIGSIDEKLKAMDEAYTGLMGGEAALKDLENKQPGVAHFTVPKKTEKKTEAKDAVQKRETGKVPVAEQPVAGQAVGKEVREPAPQAKETPGAAGTPVQADQAVRSLVGQDVGAVSVEDTEKKLADMGLAPVQEPVTPPPATPAPTNEAQMKKIAKALRNKRKASAEAVKADPPVGGIPPDQNIEGGGVAGSLVGTKTASWANLLVYAGAELSGLEELPETDAVIATVMRRAHTVLGLGDPSPALLRKMVDHYQGRISEREVFANDDFEDSDDAREGERDYDQDPRALRDLDSSRILLALLAHWGGAGRTGLNILEGFFGRRDEAGNLLNDPAHLAPVLASEQAYEAWLDSPSAEDQDLAVIKKVFAAIPYVEAKPLIQKYASEQNQKNVTIRAVVGGSDVKVTVRSIEAEAPSSSPGFTVARRVYNRSLNWFPTKAGQEWVVKASRFLSANSKAVYKTPEAYALRTEVVSRQLAELFEELSGNTQDWKVLRTAAAMEGAPGDRLVDEAFEAFHDMMSRMGMQLSEGFAPQGVMARSLKSAADLKAMLNTALRQKVRLKDGKVRPSRFVAFASRIFKRALGDYARKPNSGVRVPNRQLRNTIDALIVPGRKYGNTEVLDVINLIGIESEGWVKLDARNQFVHQALDSDEIDPAGMKQIERALWDNAISLNGHKGTFMVALPSGDKVGRYIGVVVRKPKGAKFEAAYSQALNDLLSRLLGDVKGWKYADINKRVRLFSSGGVSPLSTGAHTVFAIGGVENPVRVLDAEGKEVAVGSDTMLLGQRIWNPKSAARLRSMFSLPADAANLKAFSIWTNEGTDDLWLSKDNHLLLSDADKGTVEYQVANGVAEDSITDFDAIKSKNNQLAGFKKGEKSYRIPITIAGKPHTVEMKGIVYEVPDQAMRETTHLETEARQKLKAFTAPILYDLATWNPEIYAAVERLIMTSLGFQGTKELIDAEKDEDRWAPVVQALERAGVPAEYAGIASTQYARLASALKDVVTPWHPSEYSVVRSGFLDALKDSNTITPEDRKGKSLNPYLRDYVKQADGRLTPAWIHMNMRGANNRYGIRVPGMTVDQVKDLVQKYIDGDAAALETLGTKAQWIHTGAAVGTKVNFRDLIEGGKVVDLEADPKDPTAVVIPGSLRILDRVPGGGPYAHIKSRVMMPATGSNSAEIKLPFELIKRGGADADGDKYTARAYFYDSEGRILGTAPDHTPFKPEDFGPGADSTTKQEIDLLGGEEAAKQWSMNILSNEVMRTQFAAYDTLPMDRVELEIDSEFFDELEVFVNINGKQLERSVLEMAQRDLGDITTPAAAAEMSEIAQNSSRARGAAVASYRQIAFALQMAGGTIEYDEKDTEGNVRFSPVWHGPDGRTVKFSRDEARPVSDQLVADQFGNFVSIIIDAVKKDRTKALMLSRETLGALAVAMSGMEFDPKLKGEDVRQFMVDWTYGLSSPLMQRYFAELRNLSGPFSVSRDRFRIRTEVAAELALRALPKSSDVEKENLAAFQHLSFLGIILASRGKLFNLYKQIPITPAAYAPLDAALRNMSFSRGVSVQPPASFVGLASAIANKVMRWSANPYGVMQPAFEEALGVEDARSRSLVEWATRAVSSEALQATPLAMSAETAQKIRDAEMAVTDPTSYAVDLVLALTIKDLESKVIASEAGAGNVFVQTIESIVRTRKASKDATRSRTTLSGTTKEISIRSGDVVVDGRPVITGAVNLTDVVEPGFLESLWASFDNLGAAVPAGETLGPAKLTVDEFKSFLASYWLTHNGPVVNVERGNVGWMFPPSFHTALHQGIKGIAGNQVAVESLTAAVTAEKRAYNYIPSYLQAPGKPEEVRDRGKEEEGRVQVETAETAAPPVAPAPAVAAATPAVQETPQIPATAETIAPQAPGAASLTAAEDLQARAQPLGLDTKVRVQSPETVYRSTAAYFRQNGNQSAASFIDAVVQGGLLPARVEVAWDQPKGTLNGRLVDGIGRQLSVTLYSDALASPAWGAEVLLHELVHTIAIDRYRFDPVFKGKLADMLGRARKAATELGYKGRDYGLTDTQEFISEAFSNREFQAFLAQVPGLTSTPQAPSSLWSEFLQALREFIRNVTGLNSRTLLDDVIGTVLGTVTPAETTGAASLTGTQVPGVPEGMTRLYRIRVRPEAAKPMAEWIRQARLESGAVAAEGRWFVADPSMLDFYKEDYGDSGELVTVDIPTADLEKYRVSNLAAEGNVNPRKFSLDPRNEFFVSPEIARQAAPTNAASLTGTQEPVVPEEPRKPKRAVPPDSWRNISSRVKYREIMKRNGKTLADRYVPNKKERKEIKDYVAVWKPRLLQVADQPTLHLTYAWFLYHFGGFDPQSELLHRARALLQTRVDEFLPETSIPMQTVEEYPVEAPTVIRRTAPVEDQRTLDAMAEQDRGMTGAASLSQDTRGLRVPTELEYRMARLDLGDEETAEALTASAYTFPGSMASITAASDIHREIREMAETGPYMMPKILEEMSHKAMLVATDGDRLVTRMMLQWGATHNNTLLEANKGAIRLRDQFAISRKLSGGKSWKVTLQAQELREQYWHVLNQVRIDRSLDRIVDGHDLRTPEGIKSFMRASPKNLIKFHDMIGEIVIDWGRIVSDPITGKKIDRFEKVKDFEKRWMDPKNELMKKMHEFGHPVNFSFMKNMETTEPGKNNLPYWLHYDQMVTDHFRLAQEQEGVRVAKFNRYSPLVYGHGFMDLKYKAAQDAVSRLLRNVGTNGTSLLGIKPDGTPKNPEDSEYRWRFDTPEAQGVNPPPMTDEQRKLYQDLITANLPEGETLDQGAFDEEIAGYTMWDANAAIKTEIERRLLDLAAATVKEKDGEYVADLKRSEEIDKLARTLSRLRTTIGNYKFREWVSPSLTRRLRNKSGERVMSFTEAAQASKGRTRPGVNAISAITMYDRNLYRSMVDRAMFNRMMLQTDYNGMPLVLVEPSLLGDQKADDSDSLAGPEESGVRPAQSIVWDDVLRQYGTLLAQYMDSIGQPVKFDAAADLKTVREGIRSMVGKLAAADTYKFLESPYPSVSRIWAVRGETADALNHIIQSPIRWFIGDHDVFKTLHRITQWSKIQSVGWSIFFPIALLESVVAGTGLARNFFRNPIKNTKSILEIAREIGSYDAATMEELVGRGKGGPKYSQFLVDVSGMGVDLGGRNMAEDQKIAGVVERDTEAIVDRVRQAYGQAAADRARKIARTISGQGASQFFFGKMFPAIKLWAAYRLADQWARERFNNTKYEDLKEADKNALLNDVAVVIDNAYGGVSWARLPWATPRMVQVLNLTIFAPIWTMAAWNVAGGGLATGALLRNTVTKDQARFYFLQNWPAMYVMVMLAGPLLAQAAIWAASGGGDDDDRPFPWQNEVDRADSFMGLPYNWYADVTPLVRSLPGYKGDPTGKRRAYVRFGKQSYEVLEGWLKDPVAQLARKLSNPAKLVIEEITGKSPGSDWNLEFAGKGMIGWFKVDKEGVDAFLGSRAGYALQKFLPMSALTALKNPDISLLALVAPASKGMSQGKATEALVQVFNTYANETAWMQVKRDPAAREVLARQAPEIVDALERNGYDSRKAIDSAKGVVLGRIYSRIWAALEDNDMKEVERLSFAALRVGGSVKGALNSMKSKAKMYRQEMSPEMTQAMREAFGEEAPLEIKPIRTVPRP